MGPACRGGGCRRRAPRRPSPTTQMRGNILALLAGSLRVRLPPARCPQCRTPLPRGPAPHNAVLFIGWELQCFSQACPHHWAARAHRQRPSLPVMQAPARRAVGRPEEHLRVHPPARWLLPSGLLVRGEAIDADHGSSPPTSAQALPGSAIGVQPPPCGRPAEISRGCWLGAPPGGCRAVRAAEPLVGRGDVGWDVLGHSKPPRSELIDSRKKSAKTLLHYVPPCKRPLGNEEIEDLQ
jgi:hypothetical protein